MDISNNLLIQWGYVTGSETKTVTYALAYSTFCLLLNQWYNTTESSGSSIPLIYYAKTTTTKTKLTAYLTTYAKKVNFITIGE